MHTVNRPNRKDKRAAPESNPFLAYSRFCQSQSINDNDEDRWANWQPPRANPFEFTLFETFGETLSKVITLDADGRLVSDSTHCIMSRGRAHRVPCSNLYGFARGIETMPGRCALSLGVMRAELPDTVKIRVKANPGSQAEGFIARTQDHIEFRPGQVALILLDHDRKGVPDDVKAKLDKLGGFVAALGFLMPEFPVTGYARRLSTSASISNTETGETYEGSGGEHVFLVIADGSDTKRFLDTLHDRSWLAGLGWHLVGQAGQLLERSIIDKSVGSPERLVFEGAPTVHPPLRQVRRRVTVHDGPPLDTLSACPPLTASKEREVIHLKAESRQKLRGECAEAERRFIGLRAAEAVARGASADRAQRMARQWAGNVLLPDVPLEFADPEIGQTTVGAVLLDPGRYIDEPLADPIEGPTYGKQTAKVLRRPNGEVFVRSFAHGGANYALRHDFDSLAAIIEALDPNEAARRFCNLALIAELDPVEEKLLIDKVGKKSGVGILPVRRMLKKSQSERDEAQNEAQHEAQSRTSGKTVLRAPAESAEAGPVLAEWDDVLANIKAPEPPMRDLGGWPIRVLVRRPMGDLHELTAKSANAEEDETCTRLPAPQHTLLTPHDAYSVELEIGDYITMLNLRGKPVAPDPKFRFIHHWLRYGERSRLPRVAIVQTMPLMLPDGTVLSTNGLDRERMMVMRCDPQLLKFIPSRDSCNDDAVRQALDFLLNVWLGEVSADFASKCVAIAYALSLIERALFRERPVFVFTASQRASGKTTLLQMLILAVLGIGAPAAAWSGSEEERRKAVLGYLMEGLPTILWDNVKNGATIASPITEQISTSTSHTDRILAKNKNPIVPCHTINAFVGNNVRAAGDLASRSLYARLLVDRHDPQNREFKHADPIAWTRDHRGQIIKALYTLLLGNSRLSETPKTRFKTWCAGRQRHRTRCTPDGRDCRLRRDV